MKHTFSIVAFLAAFSLLTALQAAPNRAASAAPGKVYIYKTSHGQPQKMEVYFPEKHDSATNKVPGVLLFHGGSWRGGDLNQLRYACAYLAKRGLVAATADYYMHSDAEAKALPGDVSRKRVCVTDAASALRWFKQHADEFGMDSNRIVIGGASAGGHIALLATLQRELDDPADPKGIDTSVLGYLFFCSAFITDGKDNDQAVDAFAHLKPGIAPSLFLFGEKDSWLPATEKLVPALRKTGARAELMVADSVGHMFSASRIGMTAVWLSATGFSFRSECCPAIRWCTNRPAWTSTPRNRVHETLLYFWSGLRFDPRKLRASMVPRQNDLVKATASSFQRIHP